MMSFNRSQNIYSLGKDSLFFLVNGIKSKLNEGKNRFQSGAAVSTGLYDEYNPNAEYSDDTRFLFVLCLHYYL